MSLTEIRIRFYKTPVLPVDNINNNNVYNIQVNILVEIRNWEIVFKYIILGLSISPNTSKHE